LRLETVSARPEEVPALLQKIMPLIKTTNPIMVGISLPLFLACRQAKKLGIKKIFCGQGADELFIGYARFRESKDVKSDSLKALEKLQQKDLACCNAIAAANGLKLVSPFLEKPIIDFALALPQEFKLSEQQNKIILRSLAEDLGLPKEFAERKKVAAQYGSNFDKALEKLAKVAGAKGKSDYLSRFLKNKKMKITSLFSGGKDSCLALWLMQKQGFEIACLVSILPPSEDSFMYHKPNEKVLRLQSKALGIPLIVRKTKGEKEKELADLKKALIEAKKKFGIEGVVSGALYSNYQRERIQKICNRLRLKLFSPLWHKKQEEELRELVDAGFVFIMTKIAALGLDGSWLGKPIGAREITLLEALNKKFGFNAAGEGGEFESLVLDAPNFSKRIIIEKAEKKLWNEFNGVLLVQKASLS
jgi:asparagine synthase (glutamine-hydrolysing)